MQKTVYNPQKTRLETIDITFTDKNTTWFDAPDNNTGVSLIADFEGGLLIAGSNYSYPVLIYDVSRSDINHDRQKAEELKRMHTA
jgi:hypothetical protein